MCVTLCMLPLSPHHANTLHITQSEFPTTTNNKESLFLFLNRISNSQNQNTLSPAPLSLSPPSCLSQQSKKLWHHTLCLIPNIEECTTPPPSALEFIQTWHRLINSSVSDGYDMRIIPHSHNSHIPLIFGSNQIASSLCYFLRAWIW